MFLFTVRGVGENVNDEDLNTIFVTENINAGKFEIDKRYTNQHRIHWDHENHAYLMNGSEYVANVRITVIEKI